MSLAKEKNDLVDTLVKIYDLDLPCYATSVGYKLSACTYEEPCDACKTLMLAHDALVQAGREP